MSSSRPGYCGRCGGWRGTVSNGASPDDKLATTSKYWASKTAGDLLALTPWVAGKPAGLRRGFRDNVDSCLRHLFRSNGAEFAKFQRTLVTDFLAWQVAIVNESFANRNFAKRSCCVEEPPGL